jgi:hypothetical protein
VRQILLQQRVDVEIKSTKQRQTYYGALDYLTKQFVVKDRKYARLCRRFGSVKFLFQLVTHCQTFAFAKAFMYGYCSSLI